MKAAIKGRGVLIIRGEAADSSQYYIYIYIYIYINLEKQFGIIYIYYYVLKIIIDKLLHCFFFSKSKSYVANESLDETNMQRHEGGKKDRK